MGVDLFFVLSGFLITNILLKEKNQKRFGSYIRNFYARRTRRILPAYIASLIVGSLVFGTSWLKYWYLYIGGMNFLLALKLPTPYSLLWSLAVEEQFYLLWPVAVFFMQRKHLSYLALLMVVLAPVLRFACTPYFSDHWPIYTQLPFRMDTLALGAFIAVIWPDVQAKFGSSYELHKRIVPLSAWLLVLAFCSLCILQRCRINLEGNTPIGNISVYECTLVISVVMLLMALSGYAKAFFSFAPLVSLGRISYSFYLIHLTVMHIAPNGNIVLAAAGSLLYSVLMWHLVEKPILSYASRGSTDPADGTVVVKALD